MSETARCPFCLVSFETDIPSQFEGASAAHDSCMKGFFADLSAATYAAERGPEALERLRRIFEIDGKDPTWGYQMLQAITGRGLDPGDDEDE